MRIPTLIAIALFSINGILHGQPLGTPASFEFSGSLQQINGEAGFQIGQSGDIISQLSYDVDATVVALTARTPLSPAIWLRGEVATSLSGDGESEDLDWQNGALTDVSVSQTDEHTATAVFRALVTGGPRWIPDSGQIFEFQTQWGWSEGEWLLSAASWEPVSLEEAL